MCKKLIVALMVLSISSVVLADEVVISSFETGMDGWVVQGSGNTATPGVSSTGATDGFYSLNLQTPDSWWNEALYIDLGSIEGGKDAFLGHNTLSLDVSWLGSEWVTANSGWAASPTIALLVNPDKGWYWGVSGTPPAMSMTNWWNAGSQNTNLSPGSWAGDPATYTPGADGTATLSWNYQTATNISGVDFDGNPFNGGGISSESTVYKLILQVVHSQFTGTPSLYIDNVKLSGDPYVEVGRNVPEPTTICLLGLGTLALLRRKK